MKKISVTKQVAVVGSYDVVVVGGGPAGVFAAIAAAREGAKVALVERFGFLGGMLSENDCDQCAIFAYGFDGQLYAGLKYVTWDEENNTEKVEMTVLSTDEENLEFFQEVDAEFGLHCYGLIIETKNGEWKIIEV